MKEFIMRQRYVAERAPAGYALPAHLEAESGGLGRR
jgi:hypothetical protein